MKKKILLFVAIVAMLVCLFAISASAAETIDGITYQISNGKAEVTKANQSCTLETVIIPEAVTFSDGKSYPVKIIKQEAFCGNTSLKYLSLPATITKIEPSAFRSCKNLQFVDFNDNQNNIDFNNWGHFAECTSLKAFAFPDNVTTITNRILYKCTSLEAVYLPANAVKIGSNGGGQGPFCDNGKMYFVQEKFEVRDENGEFYGDKFVQPAKPSVYVMPSTLTTVIGHVRKEFGGNGGSVSGSIFQNCTSLNSVIVFGENFKYIGSHNLFSKMGTSSSPKTVVFLADIQGAVTLQNAQYVSFVFANANDKAPVDLGFVNILKNSNNTDSYMYFCAEGSKYDYHTSSSEISDATAILEYANGLTKISEAFHVANPLKTETTPADCVNNATATTYCFCTVKIGTSEVENSALGHEYDLAKGAVKSSVEYANYLANGILKIKCARCTECQENKVNPIITEFKGFSVNGKGDAITFGYTFDNAAISEFEEVNSCKVELGFVIAVKAFAGNDAYTSDKAVKATVTDDEIAYTGADFILRGTWDKMVDLDGDGTEETDVKDVAFYMAGYILVNGAVTYLNYGASGATADTVTFNTCNKQETPEIVE